jgi:Uma2 family endonuclease
MLQTKARWATYRVPDSVPDDTEERIVGTEWHQEAIGDTAGKLREGARRQGAAWGVCEQIAIAGLRHADGRPYDPRPDVMVLSRPLPSGSVSTIALVDVGAPLFILEVASRSTMGDDVGDKRQAYEAIGVPEYMVFDPDGALLSMPLLAWRLDGDTYVPWRPGGDGLWHSAALGLSLRATQPLLTVYDHAGQEIPGTGGLHALTESLHAQLEEERRRSSALEEEIRRLREGPVS